MSIQYMYYTKKCMPLNKIRQFEFYACQKFLLDFSSGNILGTFCAICIWVVILRKVRLARLTVRSRISVREFAGSNPGALMTLGVWNVILYRRQVQNATDVDKKKED